MRRPNFFIVGAPKCGTTALWTYLSKHPDIFMSPLKEPHFFSTDLHPEESRMKPSDYLALFSQATNQKRVGEASAAYLYSKRAADNIKQFDPTARIIIMLRAPVDMMCSLHSDLCFRTVETITSFEEALKVEPDRKNGLRIGISRYAHGWPIEYFCYREMAKFKSHVQHYINVFQFENVHIVDFDQLKKETDRVFRDTCDFLGVKADVSLEFPIVNENRMIRSKKLNNFLRNPPLLVRNTIRATVPFRVRRVLSKKLLELNAILNTAPAPRPPLNPELRAELNAEFAQDVEDLGRMLGRDFRHWTK